ncbi:MAG: hypothetical protein ACK4Z8_04815 [Novosphingobium sp.]
MWNTTPQAQAILAGIKPADLRIVRRTPPIGPTYFAWGTDNAFSERLQALREAAVAELTGATFATTSDRAAWLDAYEAAPSVEDALNARFGDPDGYASAWGYFGRSDNDAVHRMNAAWQGECAGRPVREAA